MALKKKLTTAPEAALQGHYRKISETEWVLDLEGDEPSNDNRLDEFRNNNISLTRERDELRRQLEDSKKQAAPKEQEAKTLSERLAQVEQTLATERSARDAAEKRARQESFRSSFVGATNTHKVRDEGAGKALYAIAGTVFREEKDGSYKPYDGDKLLYSKVRGKETEPMGVDEWVQIQREGTYKDLFSQPQGGNGKGSQHTDTSGFMRITAAQAANPNAEQLKAMADKKVIYE